MTTPTVAALYVRADGPYADMDGVEAWTAERDATTYAGPHPVVAHPPCGPWGRYAHRCRQDASAAIVAVDQVRRWGGVLEHPAGSRLWAMGLPRPGMPPDAWGGYALVVEQGWWGHPAPKRTWLYVVGVKPLELPESFFPPPVAACGRVESLSRRQRELTPLPLARCLVEIARRARPAAAPLL